MAVNMKNTFSKYQLYTVTNYSMKYFLHKTVLEIYIYIYGSDVINFCWRNFGEK